MTVEELWQERLAEARMETGRGLQPEALAERYDAETEEEIKELTNQATKECIRGGHSIITLDDLDLAEEKLEEAGNYEIVTDGGQCVDDTKHSGELERFAVERALYAAWTTELWIPADPDYGFVDYFEAAAARNLSLLRGFEELAEDIDRRGIITQTDTDQAKLVTDGGRPTGDAVRGRMASGPVAPPSDVDDSGSRPVPCPDCDNGTLQVSDAVYADCDNCDAAALRTEVGI